MNATAMPAVLQCLDAEQWVTGGAIGAQLGIGRAAVWKQIDSLRDCGVEVDAQAGIGYRLRKPPCWLDRDQIVSWLDATRSNTAVEVVWQTGSTSADLWQRETVDSGWLALMAESQTGGRGRRGRPWTSPAGAGLWLSMRGLINVGLAQLSGLAIAVAVVTTAALRQTMGIECQLKWPNDLYLQHRKLGGVLVEARGETNGPCDVVIGIGINCDLPKAARAGIDQANISLADVASGTIDRNRLAAALLNALGAGLQSFTEKGLVAFSDDWNKLDMLRGHQVMVERESHPTLHGTPLGIDRWGRLRVQDSSGVEHLLSDGEVRVRIRA